MKEPMKAATKIPTDDEIPMPCLVSGKLDGVGAVVYGAELLSRNLIDIPNKHTYNALSYTALEGLHGELTLRNDMHNFNKNMSAFTTIEGKPDFIFNVFDDFSSPNMPAEARKAQCKTRVEQLAMLGYPVVFCQQHKCSTIQEVHEYYAEYRSKGYEGLIISLPSGLYKFGRSTLKQALSLKLKPCADAEAEVVGYEEMFYNLDAGNSIRKDNLVPSNMLGALVCKLKNGVTFNVGSGFTEIQRIDLWQNKEQLIGKLITFKFMHYFPATGIPRHPVFKGFRSKVDA
ncbi:DNA ligase [Dickeya phage Amaethon]|nr:DNA ligase [Dickeya phage Amaethon]